ncbi:tRNA pseudouridine(38-40) synthase TruA [Treponema sp. SP13]|uniref:tRNA pseudouridine(38-40) synthase TruA n=1 Tax=Treponema sp. SP13 TaxID=2789742 RepID=UPI003D8A50F5
MRNILLTLSYDGTDFCGWQRQDRSDAGQSVRTVQAVLEEALAKLHGSYVTLYGSGRTDSGVHALSQAANFFSPIDSIPIEKYPLIINNMLPPDVRVMSAVSVDEKFNARYSATSRVYRYCMFASGTPPAHLARYVWPLFRMPDVQKLNKLAACLSGELDCASFAASGDESLSTNRYIERARFFSEQVFPYGTLVVFEIKANAFLWKMVRTLTGTLLQLEKKGAPDDALKKIIDARDRKKAGITAPPQGLFLHEVKFDGKRRHA